MTETEYLKQLVEINGIVLAGLGKLIIEHLPAAQPRLELLGDEWARAVDSLEAEYKDVHKDDQYHIIIP